MLTRILPSRWLVVSVFAGFSRVTVREQVGPSLAVECVQLCMMQATLQYTRSMPVLFQNSPTYGVSPLGPNADAQVHVYASCVMYTFT